MELTREQIEWIENNMLFFTSNIKPRKDQVESLFAILTHIDGKQHKPTGCGRCVASARNRVWAEYKKQIQK